MTPKINPNARAAPTSSTTQTNQAGEANTARRGQSSARAVPGQFAGLPSLPLTSTPTQTQATSTARTIRLLPTPPRPASTQPQAQAPLQLQGSTGRTVRPLPAPPRPAPPQPQFQPPASLQTNAPPLAPPPQQPPPASVATPALDPPNESGDFVPKGGGKSAQLEHMANLLGNNQKGVSLIAGASKKPLNGLMAATAAGVHNSHFPNPFLPLNDAVNLAAYSATAISSHNVKERYAGKVDAMLAADVARFESAAAKSRGQPTTAANLANMSAEDRAEFDKDPTLPHNQLITQDSNGKWQYDTRKLTRIAKDADHPQSRHARDVLTAIDIMENRGKRRDGAAYASLVSAAGVAANSALLAGTVGGAAPAVIGGQVSAAVKETLDFKKMINEHRQIGHNERADEVQRHVNKGTSNLAFGNDVPLEAQAGVYAAQYDKARLATAPKLNFLGRRPVLSADDTKAKLHKDDRRDLSAKHTLVIVKEGMGRASVDALKTLAAHHTEPGIKPSERVANARQQIAADPELRMVHRLLTDVGLTKGDAAMTMAKLGVQLVAEHEAAVQNTGAGAIPSAPASASAPASLTPQKQREKIADMIGEPGLKIDASKDAETAIKAGLGLRS